MSRRSRWEYLKAIYLRYGQAGRREKQVILTAKSAFSAPLLRPEQSTAKRA